MEQNVIFEDNKVKFKCVKGTYCQEKDTNCSFDLDKDQYLGVGDTFIWQPRENFPGIRFEVLEVGNWTLIVRELSEEV